MMLEGDGPPLSVRSFAQIFLRTEDLLYVVFFF